MNRLNIVLGQSDGQVGKETVMEVCDFDPFEGVGRGWRKWKTVFQKNGDGSTVSRRTGPRWGGSPSDRVICKIVDLGAPRREHGANGGTQT